MDKKEVDAVGAPLARRRIERAITLLRDARDLLVAAECPKAAARVRLSLSSALGAQRAEAHRVYRDERRAQRAKAKP